jgi:hypothetical protein
MLYMCVLLLFWLSDELVTLLYVCIYVPAGCAAVKCNRLQGLDWEDGGTIVVCRWAWQFEKQQQCLCLTGCSHG